MKASRFPPDDPREWLNRAQSNLVRARHRVPGAYLEDQCFDAQQAAEKAIKAVLLAYKKRFPYVHDLAELLNLLEAANFRVPSEVRQAARLTRYAILGRYLGFAEPVSEEEFEEAVSIAEVVVAWAKDSIQSHLVQESPADG